MDVAKVAALAKINLTTEEKELLQKDFEKIVKWIDELKDVDTTDVKPFISISNISKLRDDIPQVFNNRNGIIKNFPESEFDFVKVKKVIE